MIMAQKWLNKVKWDDNGLVPVIVQETGSNDVLMFAFIYSLNILLRVHNVSDTVVSAWIPS